jgi:hypothetical protein
MNSATQGRSARAAISGFATEGVLQQCGAADRIRQSVQTHGHNWRICLQLRLTAVVMVCEHSLSDWEFWAKWDATGRSPPYLFCNASFALCTARRFSIYERSLAIQQIIRAAIQNSLRGSRPLLGCPTAAQISCNISTLVNIAL